MEISGKTFVVTGGGNGIGRHTVLALLQRGAAVASVDIRQEGLDETAALAAAGAKLASFAVDITDREAVLALPSKVEEALGPADALVNVAGIIQPFVRVNDLEFDTIERVMNVNFYGTLNMVKAFLPGLLTRPVAHIANVSSMGGFFPFPGQSIYGASKAAVKLLTEGLYAELLDTNVGVSVVMPGSVGTEITANSGVATPGGEAASSSRLASLALTPEEAARILVDGIEEDQYHVYVGKDSRVMNIMTRVAPKFSSRMIQKQMKGMIS